MTRAVVSLHFAHIHLITACMNDGTKWLSWIVVAIVVIGGGWWLLANHHVASDQAGPIKIGFIGPLSGDLATLGQPMQQALTLAADEINAKGGINGRQIQMVFQDGRCDGQAAASAAHELIDIEHVQAIIGGSCSGEASAVVPIGTAAKVFMLSPSATAPALSGASAYFARIYPSDSSQGDGLAVAAYNKGWHKVAVIQEQTDYAAGIYKTFDAKFTSLGGQTTNDTFATTNTDFRSILTKMKAANPDAVLLDSQSDSSMDRILQQVQALGWKPQIIGTYVIAGNAKLIAKYSPLLEGTLTAEFIPNAQDPIFSGLISSLKSKYGIENPPYQDYLAATYDSLNLLAQGIAKVGYDGTKLAAWSRTVSDYHGASGNITINADGDRIGSLTLETIHNGIKQPFAQ